MKFCEVMVCFKGNRHHRLCCVGRDALLFSSGDLGFALAIPL